MESSVKLMDVWLAAFFVFSGYLFPVDLFPELAQRPASDVLPFRYQIGLPVELATWRAWTYRLLPCSCAVGVGAGFLTAHARPLERGHSSALRRPSAAKCAATCACSTTAAAQLGAAVRPSTGGLPRRRRDFDCSVGWARRGAAVRRVRWHSASPSARIPGWSFGEALVVTGWFILLQGVLEGAINPGLASVVDHIRKGTLDFVLLKPADAQFLVSTSRFSPWRVFSRHWAPWRYFSFAFWQHGRARLRSGACCWPLVLLAGFDAAAVLAVDPHRQRRAFFVVKVDNLTYLFSSIFDAARWPVERVSRRACGWSSPSSSPWP
jgi:hypothetical protein